MKKKLTKDATLGDVLKAVNDIKGDIHFLRTDSIDMEDHINNKISLSENRLKHQIEINHSEIMDKLKEITGENNGTVHPNFKHFFPSTASG